MTERVLYESSFTIGITSFNLDDTRGWLRVNRWSGRVEKARLYYRNTGLMAVEATRDDGDALLTTAWREDGSVWHQVPPRTRTLPQSPPWLWGVTDQTAPSIPAWMKDDERWQAALDAQK